MSKKNSAPKTPPAAAAPEAAAQAEAEAAAPEAAAAQAPKGLIMVCATQGYMFEPFQRIPLPEGHDVPVKETGWVISQIEAGLLKRV